MSGNISLTYNCSSLVVSFSGQPTIEELDNLLVQLREEPDKHLIINLDGLDYLHPDLGMTMLLLNREHLPRQVRTVAQRGTQVYQDYKRFVREAIPVDQSVKEAIEQLFT